MPLAMGGGELLRGCSSKQESMSRALSEEAQAGPSALGQYRTLCRVKVHTGWAMSSREMCELEAYHYE